MNAGTRPDAGVICPVQVVILGSPRLDQGGVAFSTVQVVEPGQGTWRVGLGVSKSFSSSNVWAANGPLSTPKGRNRGLFPVLSPLYRAL